MNMSVTRNKAKTDVQCQYSELKPQHQNNQLYKHKEKKAHKLTNKRSKNKPKLGVDYDGKVLLKCSKTTC